MTSFTPFNPKQFNLLNSQGMIYLILAILLIATRPYHFASALHLPSASLAVFFLLGFFQSRFKVFLLFYALSIGIDLSSSYARGAFGDCLTRTYPMLIVCYFVLWSLGNKCFFKLKNASENTALAVLKTLVGLFIASSISFFISNGSYYWFSGKFEQANFSQYSERVAMYYLPHIQSPFLYVSIALACYVIAHQLYLLKRENFVSK